VIAVAVDERYRALALSVTSRPVFESDLLVVLQMVITEDGPTHAGSVTTFHEAPGPPPRR
jgi:hypothetical protein